MIDQLKASGQYENTIIVVCSDNGWQMPRGLANMYDFGTRVPLIIVRPDKIKTAEVINDIVSLNNLAPTCLQAAGIQIPETMTAKSLIPLYSEDASKVKKSRRDFIVMARERHAFSRQHLLGYPARSIRTERYLYIRNYEPERWPAGDPPLCGDVDAHMLH